MSMINSDDRIRDILARVRRIAVVGLSPDPDRPSHQVAKAMQAEGYQIVPVNPNVDKVLGEYSLPDLRALPVLVGMVDVFRSPEHVPEIVDACIARSVHTLWLQEGVVHAAAAQRAADAGIDVVMDRCMLKEYQRLLG